MAQEEIRKGPWTEQEDFQLVCFVGLFGDRRWDFIAKVSGLKVAGDHTRTGKSCRLRWVNYLHPGLKRGKMTPQEEKLVVELHSKWGNRWSRIARKLPGRTDNEIKNYWRTHMRKKAQEKRRGVSSSSSSSNCSSFVSSNSAAASPSIPKTGEKSFYDTGGPDKVVSPEKVKEQEEGKKGCQGDDFWHDIILSDEIENAITPVHDCYSEESCGFSCLSVASPTWDHHQDTKWNMIEESNMLLPISDPFFLSCSDVKLTLDG